MAMTCKGVQGSLVAYLDRELDSSERLLIQAHLDECVDCQIELAAVAQMQSGIGTVLRHQVVGAAPSSQAWSRLETKLAMEVHPSPSRFLKWLSCLAPGTSRKSIQRSSGGVTVRKGFVVATVMVVMALALIGSLAFRGATPISAQQIFDRSSSAQLTEKSKQGIQHIRNEIYHNYQAMPKTKSIPVGESKGIIETYVDTQTGKQRNVIVDAISGRVLSTFALDGTYVYNSAAGEEAQRILTVYRSKQPNAVQALKNEMTRKSAQEEDSSDLQSSSREDASSNLQQAFEEARRSANVQIAPQETWADGRQVYVLRYQLSSKFLAGQESESGDVEDIFTKLYFDAKTYQLIESRQIVLRDGKEVVLGYDRILLQETLPSGTPVVWDLSDVKGITIIDDPGAEHTDRFMEPVTASELAQRNSSAYVLKTLPEGFEVQLSALFKTTKDEESVYIVEYRNQVGEYVMVQGGMSRPPYLETLKDEYKTASGLKLRFEPSISPKVTAAIVEAPDGTIFIFTSNIPLNRVKELAEQLVPLK